MKLQFFGYGALMVGFVCIAGYGMDIQCSAMAYGGMVAAMLASLGVVRSV